jgi:D-alanine-D-alanine ligase
MQIAIVYSLPSKRMMASKYGEADEDTAIIADKVAQGLQILGHTTTLYPIDENKISSILMIKSDCVFNLIEWCGLDIELAELAFKYLRQLNIPITGSSERVYKLSGDKGGLKDFLIRQNLPTPYGVTFQTGKEKIPANLPYPMLVKPATEHCSMGLNYDSIANNEQELQMIVKRQIKDFKQEVLAEEFIIGREFEVYLVEREGKVEVLPIEEVIFKSDNPLVFQTYGCKWDENDPDYQNTDVLVAKISDKEQEQIEKVSLEVFKRVGFWGYARFDVRMKNGQVYILEANANPSVYDGDENSDINGEIIFGIKFSEYLDLIVKAAIQRRQMGELV